MYKAAGAPCDSFREHVLLNSGSFSTTANTDSDVFRETAITSGMPLRLGHVPDATAYATQRSCRMSNASPMTPEKPKT